MSSAIFQRQLTWLQRQADEAALLMDDRTASEDIQQRARLRFEAAKAQLFAVEEAKAGRRPFALIDSRLPSLEGPPA